MMCPIAEKARQCPGHPAIETEECTLTYAQLDRAVEHRKDQWHHLGTRAGQHIAFEAKPPLSTLLSLFALIRIGAVACPLSPRLPPEQRLPAAQRCSALFLPEPSHDLATLIMTSGSTAQPKPACHTLNNHLCSARAAIPALCLTSSSRYLFTLPLHHVGGIAALFRTFLAGATGVFSSLPLGEALLHHRITHASLVPTQLFRLLEEERIGSHLSCLLIGGAPLPPSLFEKARARHLPLFLTYGMTEMSSIITLAPPETFLDSLHSGSPLIENSVQIGADQEICVSGPTLFQGYWDAQAAQVTPIPSQFLTKDLGRWNPLGQLIYLGRKDRLFISGGENIQPKEIEQALCEIPGILAAQVVPIEDAEFGMRPCAYLLEAPSVRHTVSSLKAALATRLPSFKHPVEVRPLVLDLLKK